MFFFFLFKYNILVSNNLGKLKKGTKRHKLWWEEEVRNLGLGLILRPVPVFMYDMRFFIFSQKKLLSLSSFCLLLRLSTQCVSVCMGVWGRDSIWTPHSAYFLPHSTEKFFFSLAVFSFYCYGLRILCMLSTWKMFHSVEQYGCCTESRRKRSRHSYRYI